MHTLLRLPSDRPEPTLAVRGAAPGLPPTVVVVAGGTGSGKSTFVATVSDNAPSCWATRQAGVAEIGRLTLDDSTVLHLCTMPDGGRHVRRSFFTAGLIGAVIVVDPADSTSAFLR
jgi:signal recognition particle receptor subunit beta